MQYIPGSMKMLSVETLAREKKYRIFPLNFKELFLTHYYLQTISLLFRTQKTT
jgi:hypothetical protein